MLTSLIEAYPQINYLLAFLAVFQVVYFVYIGWDILDKQSCDESNRQEEQDKKIKTQ